MCQGMEDTAPQRREQGAEKPAEAPESAEPVVRGEGEGVPESEDVAEPGPEGMEE